MIVLTASFSFHNTQQKVKILLKTKIQAYQINKPNSKTPEATTGKQPDMLTNFGKKDKREDKIKEENICETIALRW